MPALLHTATAHESRPDSCRTWNERRNSFISSAGLHRFTPLAVIKPTKLVMHDVNKSDFWIIHFFYISSRLVTLLVIQLEQDNVVHHPQSCSDYRIQSIRQCWILATVPKGRRIFEIQCTTLYNSTISLKIAFRQLPLDAELCRWITIDTSFCLYRYNFFNFALSATFTYSNKL